MAIASKLFIGRGELRDLNQYLSLAGQGLISGTGNPNLNSMFKTLNGPIYLDEILLFYTRTIDSIT